MLKYLSFALFFLLSACGTLAPPSSKPLAMSWALRRHALQEMSHWQLQGAIAVHTPRDGGSANLNWQQTGQTYTLSLYGPLGSNAVQVSGKPGFVTLQTAHGQQFSANSSEQLLYRQLGWKLPVSNLYYWARGLPAPNMPAKQEFDAYHRLVRLNQGNWQLWFKQYGVFNQRELPTKIVLTHPQLNIKIVIYQWVT